MHISEISATVAVSCEFLALQQLQGVSVDYFKSHPLNVIVMFQIIGDVFRQDCVSPDYIQPSG